jgi:hypothetical protein
LVVGLLHPVLLSGQFEFFVSLGLDALVFAVLSLGLITQGLHIEIAPEEPRFVQIDLDGFEGSLSAAYDSIGDVLGRTVIGLATLLSMPVLMGWMGVASDLFSGLVSVIVSGIAWSVVYAGASLLIGIAWMALQRLWVPSHHLRVQGRTLTAGGRSVLLDGTATIELRDKELAVRQGDAYVVVRGRGPELAWVRDRLQAITQLGDATDIPDAMRGLREASVE